MRQITQNYPGHKTVHLMIGEGFVLEKPTIVTTVLGSCVSVTFHCPRKKIGAIFHALMPVMPEMERSLPVRDHYRYVDTAIHHVVRSLYRRGIKQHEIETKIFGGAQVITTGDSKPGPTNIRVAFETLSELNIRILASDIGGRKGRNLIFISDTGEVFVKTHKESALGR